MAMVFYVAVDEYGVPRPINNRLELIRMGGRFMKRPGLG